MNIYFAPLLCIKKPVGKLCTDRLAECINRRCLLFHNIRCMNEFALSDNEYVIAFGCFAQVYFIAESAWKLVQNA